MAVESGRLLRAFVLCSLVFLFFVFMAGLDFVVNRVLYGYGLCFSFGWAGFYWSVFGCCFVVFGGMVGFSYWLGSQKKHTNLKVGVGLFLSVCLLFLGGLQDVLWFVLWGGGLPCADVVWWWMPWCGLFGFWNSACQLALLGGVAALVCGLWLWMLHWARVDSGF